VTRRQFQQGPSTAFASLHPLHGWHVSETWFETSRNGQSEEMRVEIHGPFSDKADADEMVKTIEEGTAKP
jgi:hypothetical protein